MKIYLIKSRKTKLEIVTEYPAISKSLKGFSNSFIARYLFLFSVISVYLLCSSIGLYAQKVSTKLDTNSILLGDQIKLKLSIVLPDNAVVTFPQVADTMTKNIEIIKIGKIDTLINKQSNTNTYSQNITITSFDSGNFVIPALKFSYFLKNDTALHFAETDSLLLEVRKVATNKQADIKDIKDIISVPLTLREIIPYALGLIALIAIIFLIIKYWKKFRKNEPIMFIKKTEIPPHIEALRAFEKLKKKKLWENNFIKEYYSEITDILRIYIEKVMSVNAMEMTTDEITEAIAKTDLNENTKIKLKKVLVLSDLVKFAKYTPIPPDHESCFNMSVDFVKDTSPVSIINPNDNEKKRALNINNVTGNKTEI